MKISTKGRYALRLMLDLAEQDGEEYISLRAISQRQDISVKYLEQIVSQLCRMGLVKSVRGPQGGYKLAKTPKEYSVGDILRITEGNLVPVPCLEEEAGSCPRQEGCAAQGFWRGLYRTINQYIDGCTLEDLLRGRGDGIDK